MGSTPRYLEENVIGLARRGDGPMYCPPCVRELAENSPADQLHCLPELSACTWYVGCVIYDATATGKAMPLFISWLFRAG